MTDATLMLPVCAVCREPLGPGMTVLVMHPDHYNAFAVETNRTPVPDHDPVVACDPCGKLIGATLARLKPS